MKDYVNNIVISLVFLPMHLDFFFNYAYLVIRMKLHELGD